MKPVMYNSSVKESGTPPCLGSELNQHLENSDPASALPWGGSARRQQTCRARDSERQRQCGSVQGAVLMQSEPLWGALREDTEDTACEKKDPNGSMNASALWPEGLHELQTSNSASF